MNPLTNVKNLNKINEVELSRGMVKTKSSWHEIYKDSAWIFVGGLSYGLTEGDILTVFSQYGEIMNINMIRDQKTGKTKGFCFLCYANQKSTVLAVDNFNGIKLCGRTIRVDHVSNYKPPKENEKDDEITKLLKSEGCGPSIMQKAECQTNDNQNLSKDRDTFKESLGSKLPFLKKEKIKEEKYDPQYDKYESTDNSKWSYRVSNQTDKKLKQRSNDTDFSIKRTHSSRKHSKDSNIETNRSKKHGKSSDYDSDCEEIKSNSKRNYSGKYSKIKSVKADISSDDDNRKTSDFESESSHKSKEKYKKIRNQKSSSDDSLKHSNKKQKCRKKSSDPKESERKPADEKSINRKGKVRYNSSSSDTSVSSYDKNKVKYDKDRYATKSHHSSKSHSKYSQSSRNKKYSDSSSESDNNSNRKELPQIEKLRKYDQKHDMKPRNYRDDIKDNESSSEKHSRDYNHQTGKARYDDERATNSDYRNQKDGKNREKEQNYVKEETKKSHRDEKHKSCDYDSDRSKRDKYDYSRKKYREDKSERDRDDHYNSRKEKEYK